MIVNDVVMVRFLHACDQGGARVLEELMEHQPKRTKSKKNSIVHNSKRYWTNVVKRVKLVYIT